MNNPLRILLIDDNPNDRALVMRELHSEFLDLQVEQITDAKRFAQAMEAVGFDLVITDYQLHWTNGLAILDIIKAHHPYCPVIMFTSMGSEEIAVEAIKAGLDDYILKSPAHFARLPTAVRLALERDRQHRAMREAGSRHRNLFDDVPAGLYRATPSGQLVDANLAMVQMLGYPDRESLLATDAVDLYVSAEERQRWQTLVEREGIVHDFEIQLRRHDGTAIWVRSSAKAIRDSEGRLQHYEGTVEDITERKRTEEALRQQTECLKILREIDHAILVAQSPEAIAQAALQHIHQLMPCQRASVALFDFESNEAIVLAAHVNGDTSLKTGEHIPLDAYGIAAELQEGRYSFVEDALSLTERPAIIEHLLSEGVRCIINVPLISQGELIGVLDLGAYSPGAFTAEHVDIAREVADPLAVAIRQVSLHIQVQRRARELDALYKASRAIASTLDLDVLLKQVMVQVRTLVDSEGASVLLREPASANASEELIFTAAAGPGSDGLVGARMPATAGIAGWVMRERQAILVRDASSDPRFYNRIDSVTGLTTHSVLAVPMIIKGEVSGVVEAINKAGGAFTEHDLEMLEVMAGSAAIAIENARLFKGEREQRELAETLRQVGAALVSTLDVATVLDRLLEQVSRVVLNDTANIMLLEGDHVRIVRRRGYDRFGIDTSNALIAYPVTSIPNLQQMIETGEPVVIHDTHTDPNWIHRSEGDGWQRSYAGAPVRVRGQVIGFLNVHSATPGFFDHTHAERLRAFANQAAIALENARLFEAEREQSRRLQQTQAQLIHAEKVSALGRLTASIAHEINNPLQAVQGCLTLAVEELDTGLRREKLARYLDMADKEIERIANIVRRTRDFYRPAREEMQPADVRVVLESVLELVGKQLQNSRITVEYDGYETWNGNRDLPIIQANPDHLKQLFLNLVLNAIDAMSADGGTLHIHTTSDQIKGQDGQLLPAVRIEISDTGEGIPPEILSRLFEPFVTTKKDGTGLGLSISYRIVEAHNGQITAKSQVGIGTTFTVLLPVSSG